MHAIGIKSVVSYFEKVCSVVTCVFFNKCRTIISLNTHALKRWHSVSSCFVIAYHPFCKHVPSTVWEIRFVNSVRPTDILQRWIWNALPMQMGTPCQVIEWFKSVPYSLRNLHMFIFEHEKQGSTNTYDSTTSHSLIESSSRQDSCSHPWHQSARSSGDNWQKLRTDCHWLISFHLLISWIHWVWENDWMEQLCRPHRKCWGNSRVSRRAESKGELDKI